MNISKLHAITLEHYNKYLNSGMFLEWFPDATGIYNTDMELAHEAYMRENPKSNPKEEKLTKIKYQWNDKVVSVKLQSKIA